MKKKEKKCMLRRGIFNKSFILGHLSLVKKLLYYVIFFITAFVIDNIS